MFKNDDISRKKTGTIIIKRIFIILSIILFIFLSTGSANAYERPEFKDGIAESWHPGNFCVPCHYTIAGTEKAKAIDRNCKNCHQYRPKGADSSSNKIEMTKILDIHVDIVCIRCHVGLTTSKNITAADFHRVMSKTACMNCHTFENGTYIKPLKTKCSECHSRDPHVAHGGKLEKMCVACHGEFGENFVNKSIGIEDKMSPPSLLYKSETYISEYPTIGQLIINLIEQLSQILR